MIMKYKFMREINSITLILTCESRTLFWISFPYRLIDSLLYFLRYFAKNNW